MVSLLDFKRFADYSAAAVPPKAALGILKVARTDPASQNIIQVPAETRFSSGGGLNFKSIEPETIHESAKFIPVSVIAEIPGAAGNIAAGQDWSSALAGVTITNQAAFAGGADGSPAVNEGRFFAAEKILQPEDGIIESCLETAKTQILGALGLGDDAELPDKPPIDHAVYLWAKFLLENRAMQERMTETDFDQLKQSKTDYHRMDRVRDAVYQEILILIAPYRNNLAFMATVSEIMEARA